MSWNQSDSFVSQGVLSPRAVFIISKLISQRERAKFSSSADRFGAEGAQLLKYNPVTSLRSLDVAQNTGVLAACCCNKVDGFYLQVLFLSKCLLTRDFVNGRASWMNRRWSHILGMFVATKDPGCTDNTDIPCCCHLRASSWAKRRLHSLALG